MGGIKKKKKKKKEELIVERRGLSVRVTLTSIAYRDLTR